MSQQDTLYRFLFEQKHVRGEAVVLDQSLAQILANHQYPEGVKQLMAELAAATCLLTATLKFEGEITIQLQGDGPVSYAVINSDEQQNIRGIAKLAENTTASGLQNLIGKGNMVITIRPKVGEAYQGIVALSEPNLSQCLEHYFATSEQIDTKIWLFYDAEQTKAGGVLLQLLPDSGSKEEQTADLAHFATLTATLSAKELFELPIETVLHRLFHEEHVRLFEPQTVQFKCSCSKEKCLTAISQFKAEELRSILDTEQAVSITCDFCQTEYRFDESELSDLLSPLKH